VEDPPAEKKSRDENVRSVLKAIQILDSFSTLDRKLSVAEVALRTRLPRGTAHRIMNTLHQAGLLERDRDRDHYRLGMKLFEYGTTVLSNLDLQREAQPYVEALTEASGLGVHLCVFDGLQTTIVHHTKPDRNRSNSVFVLDTSPAHCTSTGKAALAFQNAQVIERVIGLGLKKLTTNTIVDPQALRAELAEVRRLGYAVDREEKDIGVRCVGAPIRDQSGRVFAAVSVSGPVRHLPLERIPELSRMVVHYANTISIQLGHIPPIQPAAAPAEEASPD
jgi:DNA-binding IclR family transcriptional regulator